MKKILIIACTMLSLTSVTAMAEGMPWSASDNKTQAALIADVERYLNNLNTLQSTFTQTSPDGRVATGEFFLQKPGKMRWAYDPPVPILMISNGDFLTYIDYELDQVSHLPLSDTMMDFIARPKLSFDNPAVSVTNFRSGANLIAVSMVQADSPEDGLITLEFTQNPIKLTDMTIVDKTGDVTRISLENIKQNIALDNELFVFKDPRKGPRIKR